MYSALFGIVLQYVHLNVHTLFLIHWVMYHLGMDFTQETTASMGNYLPILPDNIHHAIDNILMCVDLIYFVTRKLMILITIVMNILPVFLLKVLKERENYLRLFIRKYFCINKFCSLFGA